MNDLVPADDASRELISFHAEELQPLPRELRTLVSLYELGMTFAPTRANVREAMALLPEFERLSQGADRTAMWIWFEALLAAGLRGTPGASAPSKDDAQRQLMKCFAVWWETLAYLPRAVWVPATRIAYQRAHSFWPTTADLIRHMQPYQAHLWHQLSGLRAIKRAWEEKVSITRDDTPPPTPEQVAAVHDLVEQVTRSTALSDERHGLRRRPEAGALRPEQLLAACEHSAAHGPTLQSRATSFARAQTLRAQLGQQQQPWPPELRPFAS